VKRIYRIYRRWREEKVGRERFLEEKGKFKELEKQNKKKKEEEEELKKIKSELENI